HDLLVKDVVTIGVVVDLARPLVADALARAVGGSPRHAATFAPREDLDVQKILCHRAASAPSRSCSRICLLKPGETSNRQIVDCLVRCNRESPADWLEIHPDNVCHKAAVLCYRSGS